MRTIGDYDEAYLRRQKPWKLWLKILAAVIFVSLTVGATAWACGWVRAGAEVVGPGNVREQWRFAYDYEESLRSSATQWCTLRTEEVAAQKAGNADVANQRSSQRIAQEQNYARVKAQYDARLRDAFRAKLVKPADVPTTAPDLPSKLAEISCTAPTP